MKKRNSIFIVITYLLLIVFTTTNVYANQCSVFMEIMHEYSELFARRLGSVPAIERAVKKANRFSIGDYKGNKFAQRIAAEFQRIHNFVYKLVSSQDRAGVRRLARFMRERNKFNNTVGGSQSERAALDLRIRDLKRQISLTENDTLNDFIISLFTVKPVKNEGLISYFARVFEVFSKINNKREAQILIFATYIMESPDLLELLLIEFKLEDPEGFKHFLKRFEVFDATEVELIESFSVGTQELLALIGNASRQDNSRKMVLIAILLLTGGTLLTVALFSLISD